MIPEWCNDYIGAKFSEYGTSHADGFNCWTMARDIQWNHYGVVLPAYDYYMDIKDTPATDEEHQAIPDTHPKCLANNPVLLAMFSRIEKMPDWLDLAKDWVLTETPREGALALFRLRGRLLHIGTVLDDRFMIHIIEGSDACLGRYNNPIWKPTFLGMYRHCPSQ